MAIFKSQVLTQASGSVGGMTYTRTRSGLTIRARSMPVNPQTALQQAVRNATGTLASRWSTELTEEQRENWAVYASNISMMNRLGDAIFLSAMPMYVRCNTPRLQAGLAVIDDAPTLMSTGEAVLNGVVAQDPLTPFAVNFTANNDFDTATGHVLVYVSVAHSPAINFFKGPYRYNTKFTTEAGLGDLIPNPTWVAGQKIFLRARITYSDGRLSPSTTYGFVLTGTPV